MPHTLLLADDSVTIQRVIELTFADEDVEVSAVSNGQQAIERAERDKPDIVLADIGMPERDGYEVAAFIKGNPALSHVPVILLTGAFEPIDETRARAVGCDGVLVKPFEPQMVISRVKDLLAGRRPAGLWGTAPAPQGPLRQASDLDLRTPAASTAEAADPLEAYFDRLDAAFASAGSEPTGGAQDLHSFTAPEPPTPSRAPIPLSRPGPAVEAAPPESAQAPKPLDALGAWDPDIEGDAARAAAVETEPAPAGRDWAPAPVIPTAPATPAGARVPAQMRAEPDAEAQSIASPPVPSGVEPPSLVEAFAALLAAEQQTAITPSKATAASTIDDRLIEAVTERVIARLADQTVRPAVLDVAERLVREEIDRIKGNS